MVNIKENGWSEHQGAYIPVMCLSLPAPQAVNELANVAPRQTARDAGAVSRTEFHAFLFVNALEKTVQIHSQTTHKLMKRKRMMLLLVYRSFSHILWTNTLDMYISIIHNRKKRNSICIGTMGLTKVINIFVWKTDIHAFNKKKKIKKVLQLIGHCS